MKYIINITLISIILFVFNYSFGQECRIKGEKYYNKKYFNDFAVLVRDTLSNREETKKSIENLLSGRIYNEEYYPFCYVTPQIVELSEERIKSKDNLTFIGFKNKRNLRRFVRIYTAYTDEYGKVNVKIRFVTLREYKMRNYLFDYELFLLVGDKPKRLVLIDDIFSNR